MSASERGGPTFLRISYRHVAPEMTQRYQAAWRRFEGDAARRDIRAWVFASRETTGLFIEFAECRNSDSVSLSSALASADAQLDAVSPAERSGMWEEWKANGEGK